MIETVLTNRLDGGVAAPVNCLVTTPTYSHDGQVVLIPAGSRVLGETRPVQGFGETRLAVAFHRLAPAGGPTPPPDFVPGPHDNRESGPPDQVKQHYSFPLRAPPARGPL